MAEKTLTSLSSGTLNLRFMQNARRNQQLGNEGTVAPLAQAHVVDDAAWEVPVEMRRAWGLDVRGVKEEEDQVITKTVTYEQSYLPFLFPSLHDTSPSSSRVHQQPRGRRVFNKRGEEVVVQQVQVDVESAHTPTLPSSPQAPSPPSTKRKLPRLTSISSVGGGGGGNGSGPTPNAPPKKTKDARRVIFENAAATGRDLRGAPLSAEESSFRRPKNVDDPVDTRRLNSLRIPEAGVVEAETGQLRVKEELEQGIQLSEANHFRKRTRISGEGEDGDKPARKKSKSKKMKARGTGMENSRERGKARIKDLTLIE